MSTIQNKKETPTGVHLISFSVDHVFFLLMYDFIIGNQILSV